MLRKCGKLGVGVSLLSICVLLLMFPGKAFDQVPPVSAFIGTWNLSGMAGTPPSPFIAVMTFNLGGTTVEFDTSGTNSSASPGQSISLGTWRQTGVRSNTFEEENFIYDGSGNLSQLAVTSANLTLDPTPNSFSGNGSISFFSCSVSDCPGPLLFGPFPVQLTGHRF